VTRRARKYVLDTQLFINAFRDPIANEALQRFHRAFSPFEHLSVIVAQELRAGVQQERDRKALERNVLRGCNKTQAGMEAQAGPQLMSAPSVSSNIARMVLLLQPCGPVVNDNDWSGLLVGNGNIDQEATVGGDTVAPA